jgi:hypothetical protein
VVNQTSKNEHVPEVERAGRTLKERVWAVWNTMRYKLTNILVVQLTFYSVHDDQYFPQKQQRGRIGT